MSNTECRKDAIYLLFYTDMWKTRESYDLYAAGTNFGYILDEAIRYLEGVEEAEKIDLQHLKDVLHHISMTYAERELHGEKPTSPWLDPLFEDAFRAIEDESDDFLVLDRMCDNARYIG